jgi:ATP-dependent RNA helicase RhlE
LNAFKNLGLLEPLLLALEQEGYTEPTSIQQEAIPLILEGEDLLATAQTGTGKTASFLLPILQNLMKTKKERSEVRALILTPTRELAAQVGESGKVYGKHLPLKTEFFQGGVNIQPQMTKLRKGVDIVVATPGRLLDLLEHKALNLSKVEVFVLDEVDRMLDMGFVEDIRTIISLLPKKRQNLLFSATVSDEVQGMVRKLLNEPKRVEVAKPNETATLVTHIIHPVDSKNKQKLLSSLITSENWKQALVFTRTKQRANKLTDDLMDDGISATAIHSNKSQNARSKALADFKRGKVRVLVATDVAARGIDIDDLPYVVNFDLPNCPEDYVHRIGRTGRAGKEGKAISLLGSDEYRFLRAIEQLLKQPITRVLVPGFEPNSAPSGKSGGGRKEGGRRERGGERFFPKESSFKRRDKGGFKDKKASFEKRARDSDFSGEQEPQAALFSEERAPKKQKARAESTFSDESSDFEDIAFLPKEFSEEGSVETQESSFEKKEGRGSRPKEGFFKKREGAPRREDSFKKRDSGFASRGGGSFRKGPRSEGGFRKGPRSEASFSPREGSFKRGPRAEGGFAPREGGFRKGPRSEGSFGPREGSFKRGPRAEGGFRKGPREDRSPSRENSFRKKVESAIQGEGDSFAKKERKGFGGEFRPREGSFKRREGGFPRREGISDSSEKRGFFNKERGDSRSKGEGFKNSSRKSFRPKEGSSFRKPGSTSFGAKRGGSSFKGNNRGSKKFS